MELDKASLFNTIRRRNEAPILKTTLNMWCNLLSGSLSRIEPELQTQDKTMLSNALHCIEEARSDNPKFPISQGKQNEIEIKTRGIISQDHVSELTLTEQSEPDGKLFKLVFLPSNQADWPDSLTVEFYPSRNKEGDVFLELSTKEAIDSYTYLERKYCFTHIVDHI